MWRSAIGPIRRLPPAAVIAQHVVLAGSQCGLRARAPRAPRGQVRLPTRRLLHTATRVQSAPAPPTPTPLASTPRSERAALPPLDIAFARLVPLGGDEVALLIGSIQPSSGRFRAIIGSEDQDALVAHQSAPWRGHAPGWSRISGFAHRNQEQYHDQTHEVPNPVYLGLDHICLGCYDSWLMSTA